MSPRLLAVTLKALTVIIGCFLSLVSAQAEIKPSDPTEIVWHKVIGSSEKFYAAGDIIALPSGGAVLAYHEEDTGVHLRRIDDAGEKIWEKNYPIKYIYPTLEKIIVLPDGSIVGVGNVRTKRKSEGELVKFQPFAMKVDGDGSLIWLKHYKPTLSTMLNDVEVTTKGDLVFSGSTGLSFRTPVGGILVLKTDPNGDVLWEKIIWPPKKMTLSHYRFTSMILGHDNQILINGRHDPYGGLRGTSFGKSSLPIVQIVARLSQEGKLISTHEFGKNSLGTGYDALIDHNNNMIIGGRKSFANKSKNGLYISSITPLNEVKWETLINEPVLASTPFTGSGLLRHIRLLSNGNLIGAGDVVISPEAAKDRARFHDLIIICLSGEGETLWTKQYSNLAKNGMKAMDISEDGHLWIMSEIRTDPQEPTNIYLAKLELK